jgi:hypothetical protein
MLAYRMRAFLPTACAIPLTENHEFILTFSAIHAILRLFENQRREARRKGEADMDANQVPQAARARPRLNPYTKAVRRERIFSQLRLGWSYQAIASEEGLSEQRVRQIVADSLKRQGVDGERDHALLQLVRLESAQALAAEAIDAGDLKAIAPYLKVLDGLDRHQKAGATKPVYDAAARERLFAKMSRIADRLEAKARKGAGQGAADPIGGAAGLPSAGDAG